MHAPLSSLLELSIVCLASFFIWIGQAVALFSVLCSRILDPRARSSNFHFLPAGRSFPPKIQKSGRRELHPHLLPHPIPGHLEAFFGSFMLITNVQGIELVLTGTASFGLNPFASTSQQWNAIDKEGPH
jgi:hypothetical protein